MNIKSIIVISLVALILKDALSILKSIYPSYSAITIMPALATVLLLAISIEKAARKKITTPDIVFLTYLFVDSLIFIIINSSGLGQSYSAYSMAVSFFYMTLLPLTIYTTARAYPAQYIGALNTIFKIGFPLIVLTCATQQYFTLTNKDATTSFFLELYESGAISYPIQSHANGYEIRLQGIFYSSLGLAIFMLFSASMALSGDSSKKSKILTLFVIFLIAYFSYNRNGIITLAFFMSLLLISNMRIKKTSALKVITLPTMVILLAISIAIPLASGSLALGADDSNAIVKLSTLSSRLYTWSYLINERGSEILYGSGFVQGIAEADATTQPLMIDNLFLSKSLQSGIISTVLLYIFLITAPSKTHTSSRHALSLFIACALMFSVNNVFNDINYIVFILGYFIASKSKTLDARSNSQHDTLQNPKAETTTHTGDKRHPSISWRI